MAKNKLKGITIEFNGDTSSLSKALDSVNKKSRDVSGELAEINRMLKFDPQNTELLAQKQTVLADAIKNTKEKLDTLRTAEQQVQNQFKEGKVSEEQVRNLRREILQTESALKQYEQAAGETSAKLNKLDQETEDATGQTEKLDTALGKADATASSTAGGVDKLALKFAALATAGAAVVTAIGNSVEATHDYRVAMGKLETSFDTAGITQENALDTYRELQSILGDTDTAVEAASHLAKVSTSTEELSKWVDICTGVYATYGDSLPIQNLAEAANETAKSGEVVSALSDALVWAGQSEDIFAETLKACNTEQERTTLITETLNGLYADAADKYRDVNKEVIETNRATEKLNAFWADVGEKSAPVVNTFKSNIADLGTEFLNLLYAEEDVEDIQADINKAFERFRKDTLPKVIDALKWCKDNFDIIKSAAAGFLAVLAVNKVTTFATAIGGKLVSAYKALTGGLKTATTAQAGMNAAASINPYILLAEVVIGLATAYGTYLSAQIEKTKEAAKKMTLETHGLSDAEKELAEKTAEAADAMRQQREQTQKTVDNIDADMSYITLLKDELLNLADASGKVKEADEARVTFILESLNGALGTEYALVDGQIQKYDELKRTIEEVILTKKTELLLEAYADEYADALRGYKEAEDSLATNLAQYLETQAALADAQGRLDEWSKQFVQEYSDSPVPESVLRVFDPDFFAQRDKIQAEIDALTELLAETGKTYQDNKDLLTEYYTTIGQYETAQLQAISGNTAEASKLLEDRGYYYQKYAVIVGIESETLRNTWQQDTIIAGLTAEMIKENWKNGVAGYTEEMVKEAEDAYRNALLAMKDAYADAKGIGEDIGKGIVKGLRDTEKDVTLTARGIVRSTMDAFRSEAECHSPSKKSERIFADVGEGAVIGLSGKTKDLQKEAQAQIAAVLTAYRNDSQAEMQLYASFMPTNKGYDATMPLGQTASATLLNQNEELMKCLTEILAAIKAGKVIAIDGDKLVGATASKYDTALGEIQSLKSLGVL